MREAFVDCHFQEWRVGGSPTPNHESVRDDPICRPLHRGTTTRERVTRPDNTLSVLLGFHRPYLCVGCILMNSIESLISQFTSELTAHVRQGVLAELRHMSLD